MSYVLRQEWCLVLALMGCDERNLQGEVFPVAIDWNETHQHISGFGASSAWTAPDLGHDLADRFFSLEDGIGLSLLRIRITPEGTSDERATAQRALARGARVWASPWSPPGPWKTDGTAQEGGRLLPGRYGDWAARLATFVRDLDDDGVPLMALSAQNEPGYVASWETCEWTEAELREFIGQHLAPALAAEGLSTPIVAPESAGWRTLRRYTDAILEEPTARDAVEFVATHGYNGAAFAYDAVAEQGKELWQTETSDEDRPGGSTGMDSGLWVARSIHQDLTIADVSAWHYWWLLPRTDPGAGPDTNAALAYDGQLTRRAYVMGQFSKFVRPGSFRIAATPARPQQGVLVTAFRNEVADGIALVAVNSNQRAARQTFTLEGAELGEVTPWVTSESLALAVQVSLRGTEDSFEYELPPRSVTTFVADVAAR